MNAAPARQWPLIALIGKPNSGKTALFNTLTGSRQKVANYPGVTVERKEGKLTLPGNNPVHVIDLPGTYSLRAHSPDERITRDVVLGHLPGVPRPDVLVCVIDATTLKFSLRLVLELKRTGIPLIVALNMIDIAERRGIKLDTARLAAALGVPVVPTIAVAKRGTQILQQILAEWHEARDITPPTEGDWHEPSPDELRALAQESDRIVEEVLIHRGSPPEVTRKIDTFLLHPLFGPLALLGMLFVMFQAVFAWAEAPMDMIDAGVSGLNALVNAHMEESLLRSLLADGVIAGVGSVVIFLPQILILFLFILLLEDTGYMARAAFLLDRVMGGVGLHGKAFIPLLSSFACAIPGIMATRTIEQRRDRLTTILIAPLMTCSARLPVYTLLIAAFIPNRDVGGMSLQGLVMFGLYAAGILSALLVAWVLKRIMKSSTREAFLMELPSYKIPSLRNLTLGLWERAKVFLTRAGTMIFALMVLVWFLSTFPGAPESATQPAIHYSFAGMIGKFLEPLFAPIGFNWQIVIALVPGMAAREVAVAALGTVYALSAEGDALAESLAQTLAQSWTLPTALSFLAWYIFAPQCVATLGVIKRETNSWRWPLITFSYLMAMAYMASFAVYHLSRLAGW